jgi:hypothetical protein
LYRKLLRQSELLRSFWPTQAFGRNFLDKPELEELFYNLLGAGSEAILDCVGTPEELRLSLSLICERIAYKNTYLVQKAVEKELLAAETANSLAAALKLSAQHALPTSLNEQVTKLLEEKLR